LLQFAIPSASLDTFLANYFGPTGQWYSTLPQTDKAFYLALVFMVPFCLLYWSLQKGFEAAVERLTLKDRLPQFEKRLEEIESYHRACSGKVIPSIPGQAGEQRLDAAYVMLELLLTDIRGAYRELCSNDDVRVAIYVEGLMETKYQKPPENVLGLIASSEFGKNWFTARVFEYEPETKRYGGYCGTAWKSRRPVSGTYKKFPFFYDRARFRGNILDEPRSYLCLPVFANEVNGEPVACMLSIDSGRRYDLLLTAREAERIFILMQHIRKRIADYVSKTEFAQVDFCLVD